MGANMTQSLFVAITIVASNTYDHITICKVFSVCYSHMRLFTGDGYTCYAESDVTTTDEPPQPQCVLEVCWCPNGWEYRNNTCMRQEGEYTTMDYRDCKLHEKQFRDCNGFSRHFPRNVKITCSD